MKTPSITTEFTDEDKALKGLLDSFGSEFSLQDIATAFCKAGRDPNLASQILHGMKTSTSLNGLPVSKGFGTTKSSPSEAYVNGIYNNSQCANGNSSLASKVKRNPASVGTVSSVLGKNYVWRVAQSNGNPNETKPMKVEANEVPLPVGSCEESLLPRHANPTSKKFSLAKDASLHEDLEDFLFEMLGRGFQLERSAIREVLGQCGYDMKKSLETLLDLSAANLDKSYVVHEARNLHSNTETISSPTEVRKQKTESYGSSTNGILSRQPNGRYEQEKEVLSALFHVPERPDLTVRASASASARTSRATRAVVSEPLKDFAEDCKANAASLHHANMKDEVDEDDYHILRKAVKEHRDTMKEYYGAAAEAFASGDRARAGLLMEKGQFFYNKAREADEESALKIFETSGVGNTEDDVSLDLQDHDAREAIHLVKCHLRSLSGIPSTNLKITVGKGDRNAEKRRRLVIKLLERDAIKWIEDENLATILIRLDDINPKRLSFARK